MKLKAKKFAKPKTTLILSPAAGPFDPNISNSAGWQEYHKISIYKTKDFSFKLIGYIIDGISIDKNISADNKLVYGRF